MENGKLKLHLVADKYKLNKFSGSNIQVLNFIFWTSIKFVEASLDWFEHGHEWPSKTWKTELLQKVLNE